MRKPSEPDMNYALHSRKLEN